MKVRELIQELLHYNPDFDVVVQTKYSTHRVIRVEPGNFDTDIRDWQPVDPENSVLLTHD